MQASRRNCLCALAILACISVSAPLSRADTLNITATPPGAIVEIDGVVVGTTPYKVNYPGGYFHKPHSVFASRLVHAITIRVYKGGFTEREMRITEGPFEWTAVNGQYRGRYWLIKSAEVMATLESVTAVYHESPRAPRASTIASGPHRELSIESLVEKSSPAVVEIESMEGSGSGFFISEDGVIATNHHMVEGFATVDVRIQGSTRKVGRLCTPIKHRIGGS